MNTPLDRSKNPPEQFVRLCSWFWKKQKFIWGSIVLGVGLSVFASLLFVSWPWSTNPNLKGTPVLWLLQHPLIIMIVGTFILLIIAIIYLGSRFEAPEMVPKQKSIEVISSTTKKNVQDQGQQSDDVIVAPIQKAIEDIKETTSTTKESAQYQDKKIETAYLERMILITKPLTFTGIPSNLIIEPVSLDEVFIPLELRNNRPLTDYPLSESLIRSYQEELQRNDIIPEHRRKIERALLASETSWLRKLNANARLSFSELWRIQGKKRLPVVIQGYPGMGKTTLMLRLALHSARSSLGKPDPTMPERLRPALIPILLSLGDYANELLIIGELPLFNYLEIVLNKLNIPDIFPLFQKRLREGRCLILLDGLDEVPQNIRQKVQQEIKTFISELLIIDNTESLFFNRIIITSRVAGYDQAAFPEYSHYTIAELSEKQREDFLKYWSYAYVRHVAASESSNEQAEEVIAKEAERIAKDLAEAISYHGDLTENPLLLTLLAIMKQIGIELPKRRVELYGNVTLILLEKRNSIRNIPPIPEAQAIQRLGPLAYQMQEQGTNLIQEIDVINSLRETISNEGSNPEDTEQEARTFLKRIRERGGIFVQRAGDYFGFFHRTFQEYFVARHILNEIGHGYISIQEFIDKVLYDYSLWREPLLLAVAYNSGESDNKIAHRIIHALLDTSKDANLLDREHRLLLSVDCLIEAKPLTIDYNLEQFVAEQLLNIYGEAQKQQNIQTCINIEKAVLKWIVNLSLEIYQSSLLTTLVKAIKDTNQTSRQLAALTLLTAIAGRLESCPPIVFKKLADTLLELAESSSIGGIESSTNLPAHTSLTAIDLSLLAISFMGKQGANGLLLADVRKHFEEHSNHLITLAQLSSDYRILLSPIAIPQALDHFQRYKIAIEKWSELLRHNAPDRYKQDINWCINIHRDLLACAEEARYPIASFLLDMLKATEASIYQGQVPLQTIVQNYLLGKLREGKYINYLAATLLYQALFPITQLQDKTNIYDLIIEQFVDVKQPSHHYARHFLSMLSNDLKDLYYAWKLKGPRERKDFRSLADRGYLSLLWYLRELAELLKLKDLQRINQMQGLRSLEDLRYQLNLRDIKALHSMRSLLLTSGITDKTIELLSLARVQSADPAICIELLTILLGRILQILENDDKKSDVEVKKISRAACSSLLDFDNAEIRDIALEVISFLPARTKGEISAILKLAEESTSEAIQKACALSIQRSNPVSQAAWNVLGLGKASKVKAVQTAIETRLKQRK